MTQDVWPRVRLRSIAAICGGGTPSPDPKNWDGEIPFVTPPDLRPIHGGTCTATFRSLSIVGAQVGSSIAPIGAIMVSKRAPIGYVARLGVSAAFNQGCLAVVPSHRVDSKFLTWALSVRSTELNMLGRGTTFMEIAAGDLSNVLVDLPPVKEQLRIVRYLDRETTRVDALMDRQARLINTLRERRAAVVERALIGLPWVTPLRSVVRLIQTGPFGSQLKSDEYVEGGVPVINPSHMVGGRVVPDSRIAVGDQKAIELARHELRAGDLVAARRGELGRCAVVTPDTAGALCGTGSALVRPNADRIDARFLALIFGSRATRDSLLLASVGSTMDNLNAGIIASLRIPVPSIADQCSLLDYLDKQTAKIDALIAKAERFIEVSKERRYALITAAVTGQIDVRDALDAANAEGSGNFAEQEVQPV